MPRDVETAQGERRHHVPLHHPSLGDPLYEAKTKETVEVREEYVKPPLGN